MHSHLWNPRVPATALACALATVCADALACSTCKCGDSTLTVLGTEKPYSGRLRAGLDLLLRSESAGAGLERQDTEEQRLSLGLAYSPNADWTLAVQLPYVHKEIKTPDLARQEAEGWGDMDLTARWVAWRSGGLSGTHLAGLRAGLRLPTAEQVRSGGELLDIDVQPDAGATVPSFGAWYGYYDFPWFASVSATYFTYQEGHQDFRGGDVTLISVLGQYGLSPALAVRAGLDARHAQKNEFAGRADVDSGGVLAMASLGLALRLGEDLVLSAGAQLPVMEDLNGTQDEDANWRVGIAYDF